MPTRAAALIRDLGLQPHPEGGHYREVFRSTGGVHPEDGRHTRSALTIIYFLLADGGHSRWHRVTSDEAWCWIEGEPLELVRMDAAATECTREMLGPPGPGREAVRVVPAGEWQAARTMGSYTLVSCAVGPGFDFADFAMLSDDPRAADQLRRHFPDLAGLI